MVKKKYATDIIASTVQFLSAGNASAGASQDNSNGLSTSTGNAASGNAGADFNFGDFGPEPTFNQSEDIPF